MFRSASLSPKMLTPVTRRGNPIRGCLEGIPLLVAGTMSLVDGEFLFPRPTSKENRSAGEHDASAPAEMNHPKRAKYPLWDVERHSLFLAWQIGRKFASFRFLTCAYKRGIR